MSFLRVGEINATTCPSMAIPPSLPWPTFENLGIESLVSLRTSLPKLTYLQDLWNMASLTELLESLVISPYPKVALLLRGCLVWRVFSIPRLYIPIPTGRE